MRALVVRELLPDFAAVGVEEVADPVAGPGEVLVRVKAASVNFPDLLMTRGEYQMKPPLPFTPGLDLAGEIAAVGEGVDPARIGEAVVGGARLGGFAELAALPVAAVKPKPARLNWAEAASYGAAYLTAYVALVRRAELQPGETLLVHGAAGGVGLAAVDLGLVLGARVIATSASDDKLEQVKRLHPAAETVNVAGGFKDAVKALTDGRGADVVYDPVGGAVFEESLRCMAWECRLLVIGFTAGRAGVAPSNLVLIKGASVLGVRAGEWGRRRPAQGAENTAAVAKLVDEGAVRPHVHAEFPLDRWREAFDLLAHRKVVGKAVITL